MPEADIPPSLQESILATLCFDPKWGAFVATQVTVEHFDGSLRPVADRVLSYWKQYHKPPGATHLDDLFGEELVDQGRKRSSPIRRTLFSLVALEEGLNGEYIAHQTTKFIQAQNLKVSLIMAGERFTQGGDTMVEDVQDILQKTLSGPSQLEFDAGTQLNDTTRGLAWLDHQNQGVALGIRELDRAGLAAVRKEMLLYIGPKGSGKTWWCVHMGKQGLIHNERVVHVTLEVREELTAARYYSSIFNGARKATPLDYTRFELDKLDRLIGFHPDKITPSIDFSSAKARAQLKLKIKPWGVRLGRIVIKEFPTRQLTVSRLNTYLDWLEQVKRFIPTMLIVDYPDLMLTDKANYRISLGIIYEDLRGLAVQRNLALCVPTQGNRASAGATRNLSTSVSEDIRKVNTADNVLTYSQTAGEKRQQCARLLLDHARNTEGGIEVAISQAYGVGQYCLNSAYVHNKYWELLKEATGDDPDSDEVEA